MTVTTTRRALWALCLIACDPSPGQRDVLVPCNRTAECPDDQVCCNGLCRATCAQLDRCTAAWCRDGGATADRAAPTDAASADTSSRADAFTPDTAAPTDATTDSSWPADSSTPDGLTPVDTAVPDGAAADAAAADAAATDAATDAAADVPSPVDSSAADLPAPVDTAAPDTPAPDAALDWWDQRWHARHRITFDNADQGEDLVDFPVLVTLAAPRIDTERVAPGGEDLRFVDADGLTPLAHELEPRASANGFLAWVRVPRVDAASSSDHIWLYYDGPREPAPLPPEEVWSNDFRAVYHLGGDAIDATANGFDGALVGGAFAPGVIGQGVELPGPPAFVDLGHDLDVLNQVSAFTLSIWMQPLDFLDNPQLVSVSVNGASSTNASRAYLGFLSREIETGGRSTDLETARGLRSSGLGLQVHDLHQLVGVVEFDRGRVALYVDGEHVLTKAVTFESARTPATHSTNNALGAQDDGGGSYFAGLIDEARIASVARSADWIRAQHRSQLGSFAQIGDLELR